jgi:GT2 family glycosyltransferase
MNSPGVGVVVINWNGLPDTLACLESLVTANPGPARIVVVDNGSTDDSVDALRAWQQARGDGAVPAVTILASATNRGFTGGNNIGVEHLHADPGISHFLLLNNDATVDRTFFAELARALDAVPDAGVLGPTIYVSGRPDEVWYAGGRFVPLRTLVVHEQTVPAERTPRPTEFVTGCAMLIARRAWDTLGPLPECYFIYHEDAEYSWRAHAAGLPVCYAPRAVVYHAVGRAVRREMPRPHVEYLKTRNRVLFVRRNLRGLSRWAALTYLVVTKPGRALVEMLRGRPALGWAFLRGLLDGLMTSAGRPAPRPPR